MNHHENENTLRSVTHQTELNRDALEQPDSPVGYARNPESRPGRNSLSTYLRCPHELRNNLCHMCREIQTRILRSVTIRGVPRLFLLKRLFCLYWFIVVSLLIYLKLYFPLYLVSTVSRNTLEEFRTDWCRVRTARTDWEAISKPCKDNSKWRDHSVGWTEENTTDPNTSFISLMNINAAGEFSRISIQAQTSDGRQRRTGGDSWRIHINGPSSFAPTIIDHSNGTYEVLFLVIEPGTYRVFVFLDYSLCNGVRDPPGYWFVMGNIHGSNQRDGILGSERHFLNQPLWYGVPITFEVPQAKGPLRRDEFLSAGFGDPVSCTEQCSFLWDGFGRWTNRTWAPYVSSQQTSSPVSRRNEGVLWIYGDSNAVRFYKSIAHRHLCSSIFRRCDYTYNWVYNIHNSTVEKKLQDFIDIDHDRIIQELKAVLYRPEMNDSKSVIVLNFGLHFVSSINFTNYQRLINKTINVLGEVALGQDGSPRRRYPGDVVWKSTTAVNRERLPNPYYKGRRFITQQRIVLFNAYATWAMCKAGFKVLDVYPVSASYPGGTGTRYDTRDSVHFKGSVFDSVVTLLEKYYGL